MDAKAAAKWNADQAAAPVSAEVEKGCGIDGWGSIGLTKREAFAMAAMQAVIAKSPPCGEQHEAKDCHKPRLYAEAAVACADALLLELAKERAE